MLSNVVVYIDNLSTVMQEQALATVADWLADPTCASNATTAVVAGTIYISEEDYVAALKACHHGSSLEMCGHRTTSCFVAVCCSRSSSSKHSDPS